MKKTLALILALALCLSLAACSGLTNEPASDPSAAPSGDDAPAAENTDAPEASSDEYTPFVEVQGVDDTTIYVGNTAAAAESAARRRTRRRASRARRARLNAVSAAISPEAAGLFMLGKGINRKNSWQIRDLPLLRLRKQSATYNSQAYKE